MKKLILSFAMALTTLFAMAQQIVDVSVYDDCSKNGYTITIPSMPTGTAPVLSSAGRISCDYVQLWEGGPKWATFNVGATITDYANIQIGADATAFYNYADQAPYYNTANVGGLYVWNNPNLNGRQTTWSSSVASGIADVATTLWGSNWKTPTKEQLDTLQDGIYGKTTWIWCDGDTIQYIEGCTLKGFKIIGKGDFAKHSIFLPITGYFAIEDGTVRYIKESAGNYWSCTKYSSIYTWRLYFYPSTRDVYYDFPLYTGRAVRAILVE